MLNNETMTEVVKPFYFVHWYESRLSAEAKSKWSLRKWLDRLLCDPYWDELVEQVSQPGVARSGSTLPREAKQGQAK